MTAVPASPVQPHPLTVELVGPAGAGKTMIFRAIARRDARVRPGLRIHRLQYLPLMLWHALILAPQGLDMLWESPRTWRSGMLHLLRLKTLHTVLRKEATPGFSTIMLDEGPVFSLGRLAVHQNAHRANGAVGRVWRSELDWWARTLDVVVWLDAPDAVLAQRIHERPKNHTVKGRNEEDVFGFLERYRTAYQDVLGQMTAAGRVKVIRVPTAGESPDRAADVILKALHQTG